MQIESRIVYHELQYANMSDPDSSIEAISARVEALRLWCGFDNQREFARESGISQTDLNHYETGRRRISLNAANQLRRRWGVTLDWIFHGDLRGLDHQMRIELPNLVRGKDEPREIKLGRKPASNL